MSVDNQVGENVCVRVLFFLVCPILSCYFEEEEEEKRSLAAAFEPKVAKLCAIVFFLSSPLSTVIRYVFALLLPHENLLHHIFLVPSPVAYVLFLSHHCVSLILFLLLSSSPSPYLHP